MAEGGKDYVTGRYSCTCCFCHGMHCTESFQFAKRSFSLLLPTDANQTCNQTGPSFPIRVVHLPSPVAVVITLASRIPLRYSYGFLCIELFSFVSVFFLLTDIVCELIKVRITDFRF